ncbi:MAG: T9SS type A sorting domain-containing protein [Bacteroidia bacterium]|nr:T9SS type A sorting domain-containing protein [Bacteroidia bacterium]
MGKLFLLILFPAFILIGRAQQPWQSSLVSISGTGKLVYAADNEGNTIPDFSLAGYGCGQIAIPDVSVQETLYPVSGDNLANIQNAINRVSLKPLDANGFRGTVFLTKGLYEVNGSIIIEKSGVVIRGEGTAVSGGTIVRETATTQLDLFLFKGAGSISRAESSKVAISESFVPTGRKLVNVSNASSFHVGDSILIFRPGTDNWIHDLKMDQIANTDGTTEQWIASSYNLYWERIVTAIDGNKVSFDNPVVMQIDNNYGGGYLMHYSFPGRIWNCGIENLRLESSFASATDEAHGWNAINISRVVNSWVRNVTSVYFGMGCVYIDNKSRNISVLNSQCLDAKSIITGSRRYSFNCEGQLNLFKNCYTTEGRHDYVTGSRTCGPNVFTQCKSRNTHADIGPHHRWASGTLFDVIDTDGEINVQDRGDYGSGHGWAGVTQVLWNCKSTATAVQSPWVSGKNYCIGLIGGKYPGRFNDRPDGVWEGLNVAGLVPESLYEAQLNDRLLTAVVSEKFTKQEIRFYPNPSEGHFNISYTGDQLKYIVLSLSGKKLMSGLTSENPVLLDITGFSNGIYLMECNDGEKRSTHKIVINKYTK